MITIDSISINGFKSILESNIPLKNLNVLIGPNGSGKTNFLEFFIYMQKIIQPQLPNYPFSDWGGFNNIAYNRNQDQIIEFKIKGIVENKNYVYICKSTGNDGIQHFIYESLVIDDICNMVRVNSSVTIEYPKALVNKINNMSLKKYFTSTNEHTFVDTLIENNFKQLIKIDNVKSVLNFLHNGHYSMINNIFYGFMNNDFVLISPTLEINKHRNVPLLSHCLEQMQFFTILIKNTCGIKNSSRYYDGTHLTSDGRNLTNLLHTWYKQRGSLPPRIENAMREFFPDWQLEFNINNEGTITLVVKKNNIIFLPPSIPEGFYKLLFILSAMELKPKILLIDEIENSLHYDLIRYILTECKNNQDTITILTTHSPMVIDMVDINNIILTKYIFDQTNFSYLENIEELHNELLKNNMVLSDKILDGDL